MKNSQGIFQRQDKNDYVIGELKHRTEWRLKTGCRAVIDTMNLHKRDRINMVKIAEKYAVPVYYLVINRSLAEKKS